MKTLKALLHKQTMNRSFWMQAAMVLLLLSLPAHTAIKEEAIPDLRPPRTELQQRAPKGHAWTLAGLGVLLVSGINLLWLTMRAKKIPPPPEHPYAKAQREFNALSNKPDVDGVLGVFRNYVLNVLPVPGPGQTAEEVLTFLARHPAWTADHTTRAQRLLMPVEVAKFAPSMPMPDASEMLQEATWLTTEIERMRSITT
jgi:hypothetical protein